MCSCIIFASEFHVMKKVETVGQFILERQATHPEATGELSNLLNDISVASKIVNDVIRKAGLTNILGKQGADNVQGEEQMKLDVFANDQFIHALSAGGEICAIASEEDEHITPINTPQAKNAKYVLLMDPLDGSSNIDVNASIGTIFSVYKRISDVGHPGDLADCLQAGRKQVAAGYVIYGSSTMLVYTAGNGVNGFTLDPSIGEFCLSHPDMQIPKSGNFYSINEGYWWDYPAYIREYVEYCKSTDGKKALRARFIGSMVSDLHRTLIKGGIFMYPDFISTGNGKLRLNYECNPFAFLIEQAGGKASNGKMPILDIQPTELHQRTPILIGSADMVDHVVSLNKA